MAKALTSESQEWLLVLCLRTAALLHRARDDAHMPDIIVNKTAKGFQLQVDRDWLEGAPLTVAVLEEETAHWANVGIDFKVRSRR